MNVEAIRLEQPRRTVDILADKSPEELAAYILKWHNHLTRWFGPRMDVAGKRVLVIGSQYGPEILWAMRSGARAVVGLDPEGCDAAALHSAMDQVGLGDRRQDIQLIQATTHDAGDIGVFDYVMSNNVFEHVHGLSQNLASIARFIPQSGGRVVIFADPLFHSSQGHHLRAGSWDHFILSQDALRQSTPPLQWSAYRTTLNGMTITSFLEAVRESGMILLDLGIVPDRAIADFNKYRHDIPSAVKPMDPCLEGIVCTLAFPHNL